MAIATERTSRAPALILSGLHDPVTPPSAGEDMARHFPTHQHLVVTGAAHNTSFRGCVPKLIAAFLAADTPTPLDAACLDRSRWPALVLRDAGGSD